MDRRLTADPLPERHVANSIAIVRAKLARSGTERKPWQ